MASLAPGFSRVSRGDPRRTGSTVSRSVGTPAVETATLLIVVIMCFLAFVISVLVSFFVIFVRGFFLFILMGVIFLFVLVLGIFFRFSPRLT